jgi:hypothetical protein
MSELPLEGADAACGSTRSCAQVTMAVMDWGFTRRIRLIKPRRLPPSRIRHRP